MQGNTRNLLLFLNGWWILVCIAIFLFFCFRGYTAFESWRGDGSHEELVAKVQKMTRIEQLQSIVIKDDDYVRSCEGLLRLYHTCICITASLSAVTGVVNVILIYRLKFRGSDHPV